MPIDTQHPDYIEIRSRIRENPKDFVAIVGAGLSRPAGIPSWEGLRSALIQDARNRASEIPEAEKAGYEAALKRIESYSNLWNAFAELKRTLSPVAYEDCIRRSLSLRDRTRTPDTYDLLWQLGIKGIMTFNLDTCAMDSCARVCRCAVDGATGCEPSRFCRFLAGTHPFVFQPHGRVDDSSTWVLTHDELARLLRSQDYVEFFAALCHTKHLLILGFDPDDFAFAHLVEQRSRAGASPSGLRHYILMPRNDPGIIRDHAAKGFAVIPYEPSDPDLHSEVRSTLADWLSFTPTDSLEGSVFRGLRKDPRLLPPDDELVRLPVHEIRELLNGAVASIIPPHTTPHKDDVAALQRFYREHLRAIHLAWLVRPDSEFAHLHGYLVRRTVGRGAFGQVYEAESVSTGQRAAIKLLLPEVREDPEYLNSFRRGVRSMQILTDRTIPRMVELWDACEVPACIIMEFVDGLTMTEARRRGVVTSLTDCLEVLVQVGETVHSAHNVEERVLHRDLKPDNVILRNAYARGDAIDVVVLDFDLSWHKGALEMSVVHGARAQGYAAPEQTATARRKGISTRHTAVDVFGYGMLAYFMFVGDDPRPNEHKFSGFEEKVRDAIAAGARPTWRCLATYIAGVIAGCTRDEQGERIGLAEAVSAFREAKRMASCDVVEATSPLLLEEIAAIVIPDRIPKRSDFGRKLEIEGLDASKRLELSFVDILGQVAVLVSATKTRAEYDNRNVAKYLPRATDRAVSAMNKSPMSSVNGKIGQGSCQVTGVWLPGTEVSRDAIGGVGGLIADALAAMNLD